MFTVQTVVTAKDTGDRLSSKDGIQFSAEAQRQKQISCCTRSRRSRPLLVLAARSLKQRRIPCPG